MKSAEQVLKEQDRYLRRYRGPRRAIRQAYVELDRVLGGLVPRHFAHAGPVRHFVLCCPEEALVAELADRVVYTLDSALVRMGLRRWGQGLDVWLYASRWSELEAAERRGLLRPEEGPAAAAGIRVHACLLEQPLLGRAIGAEVRVVERERLLEDLLGSYGLRHDLFARLLAVLELRRG